jgi:hypothetical protein
MKYVFKWRRNLFWKSKKVIGHRYESDMDKMVIYFENGAIREIKKWSDCEVMLGSDWVLAQKKNLEVRAGTTIPLNI